ncbi:MAG: hypothetical protein AAF663_01765 [Planctomycetota bacterium]
MSTPRTQINVPRHVHEKLVREASKLERLARDGVIDVPSHLMHQGFPLWLVIDRLLDEKAAHRVRAKKAARGRRQRGTRHDRQVISPLATLGTEAHA